MGKQVLLSALLFFFCIHTVCGQDTIIPPARLTTAEALTKAKRTVSWQPRNILAISPNGFIPRLKYERTITNDISAGVEVRVFPYMLRGVRIDPFARYYIKNHTAPVGWFIQLKGSFAVVKPTFLSETYFGEHFEEYDSLGNPLPTEPDVYLSPTWTFAYGGGVTAGHQHLIGKRKHGIIEFFFGIRIIGTALDYKGGSFIWQQAALQLPLDAGIKFGYAWKKASE